MLLVYLTDLSPSLRGARTGALGGIAHTVGRKSTYDCAIMKIRITKYVYVHFQSQALSPQWGQQENEEMTDRHRTHTKSRVLCIGISGGPTTPRYSIHLLCRVKQRGEVSTYN